MAQKDFNNAACQNILGAESHKEVSGPPIWQTKNARVEARWDVKNSSGHRLDLRVSVAPMMPWRVHVVLRAVAANVVVSRLDTRDDHINGRTDLRTWKNQTHLHVWSESYGDHHAIDFPLQSWDDDLRELREGELEEIFRAVCTHWYVKVGDDLAWQDPSMDTGWIDMQLEGEIP